MKLLTIAFLSEYNNSFNNSTAHKILVDNKKINVHVYDDILIICKR